MISKTITKDAADYYAQFNDDGTITQKSINAFNENGFITFPPGYIDFSYLDKIGNKINNIFPAWDDGKVESENHNLQNRFVNEFTIDKTTFFGCPLAHRITRGKGSVDPMEDTNFLFGKRATLKSQHWDKELSEFIENEKILSIGKQLLNTQALSFHNGSVARSYPGNEPESKSFHSDMSAFTRDPLETVKQDRYVLNVFTYMNDVTEELAPMRLIPKTHKKYLEINEYVAKNNGITRLTHTLNQSNIYEELLPSNLETPVKIIGKKGTVIAFQCGLLHSATANTSQDKTRTVSVMNYSCREHKEFFYQGNSENYKECEKFTRNFKDRDLVEYTFLHKAKPKLSKVFIHKTKRNISDFKSSLIHVGKSTLRPTYKIVKRLINPVKPVDQRLFLNLGAGGNWQHELFVSIDQASGTDEQIDLSKKEPLPFEDDYLKGVYSSHFIEHLMYSQVKYMFKEIYRILRKGGVFRIVVPDTEGWLDAYEKKNAAYFSYDIRTTIYAQDSWLRRIVRGFAEPVVDQFTDDEIYELYKKMERQEFLDYFQSLCENEKYIKFVDPHNHKTWFGHKKLELLLKESGFETISIVTPETSACEIFLREPERFDSVKPGRNVSSLFMEAIK